ncbi:MAG: hypothetical protein FJ387_20805 [Verrucomicrobia bacterium]|nr:hypothetical protein [Verrucomicrobiota bacterium]
MPLISAAGHGIVIVGEGANASVVRRQERAVRGSTRALDMNNERKGKKDRCCWDWLIHGSSSSWPILLLVLACVGAVVCVPLLGKLKSRGQRVIVYCAQDQVYAEPILAEFTRATGIRVRPVFDSEAVKTVGLANRLLAERARPQCDVFWGNEELRTRQLAAQDVFRATNGWAALGYRSRRIVVNTNCLPLAQAPQSLRELTNRTWQGRVALAYPLFGTTATHFLALRQHWGEPAWEMWCRALVANRPFVVDGNSVVARLVARGEAWVGLTDSDDIVAVQREQAPVVALALSEEESLLIPNTVGVVRGGPHPEAAQRLFEFLQAPANVGRLVEVGALEGVEVAAMSTRTLAPDWAGLLAQLEVGMDRLGQLFLR